MTGPGEDAASSAADFFVSYTHSDEQWAEWIAWVLEDNGYRVVTQAWDFGPGSHFVAEMRLAAQPAARTIVVLSVAYQASGFAAEESQAAWVADPGGREQRLLVFRVEDCPREGLLRQLVTVDLFGIDRGTARERLLGAVRGDRRKPEGEPTFPASMGGAGRVEPPMPVLPWSPSNDRPLGEVFKPAGVPILTFVEPAPFAEFRSAVLQPGLGVVLEGPSGTGKTTILRHANKLLSLRSTPIRILSARRRADLELIRALPDGHDGIVAVDDIHRLPVGLRDELADYLKLLADDDSLQGKLIIVGIPGTARNLITFGSDLATRIRVFRLGPVTPDLVLLMIQKGEEALNVTFENRDQIVLDSAGSLLTAQMLCWHLAIMADVEHTQPEPVTIRGDLGEARLRVTETLRDKYRVALNEFVTLDGPEEVACVELLLRLGESPDGALALDAIQRVDTELGRTIDRVFIQGMPTGFGSSHEAIASNLYYDSRGRRLVADDPQFIFYIRQLSRAELCTSAGKRSPIPRDQAFVCYSRRDAQWLERLKVHLAPLERAGVVDLWSDSRIAAGDLWRGEIELALSRARVAVLLVSADFMASKFINEEELPALLAAAETGGCRIIPLLVSPSLFDDTPSLSRFQHVNEGSTTLSEMSLEKREATLVKLARILLRAFT